QRIVLRTITPARSHSFYTRRCMQLLIAKGLFLKVLGGCYLDPGMGRIRTYLLVASPSIVAMRSWRVFWDFPNVITLHILAVKVVDLTDTVYGSNHIIFPLAVRTIEKPSPYSTMFRCGHL